MGIVLFSIFGNGVCCVVELSISCVCVANNNWLMIDKDWFCITTDVIVM